MIPVFLALAITMGTAFAGKNKGKNESAPPPAPPAPPAAPAPPPEPEPEPEPEPAANNADLTVTLRFANGTSRSGHVKRIERSEDFFGDEGWLTDAAKLEIEGEAGTTIKEFPWTEVKSVTVTPGKVPADVSCTYSTEVTPWLYDCTLTTTGKAVTKDGKTWTVSNRHKWRFTFDDDSQVEFWLYKYAARMQDTTVVDLETVDPENLELYVQLQAQLKQELTGANFVTGVSIQ